jgi:DNA anti-recombination protein RmuC
MTQSSDRLDRIESVLATVAESQARTAAQQERNTEAISRLEHSIETGFAESRRNLETSINDVVEMIGGLAERQAETDQRFENLLAEARADRQRMDQRHQEWMQRFDEQKAESDRRFDEQLAEMREAREANATEHRAFTQIIQTLLAEVSRIWQRLSA